MVAVDRACGGGMLSATFLNAGVDVATSAALSAVVVVIAPLLSGKALVERTRADQTLFLAC